MPPKGRSSSRPSSHSSSSHRSSSRSSGSRSSISRSSFGSSGSRSFSRGPSSHSSGSHSSRPFSSGRRTPVVPVAPPMRPRRNQPSGFRSNGSLRTTRYRGRRHDYIFFPVAWTDESTGTTYEKGYYDENGTRYDNVSFEKDGRYENVVCHCEYCGQDSILNLSAEEVGAMSLKCPDCGAPLEIKSELDQVISAQEEPTYGTTSSGKSRSRRFPRLLIFLAVILVFAAAGRIINSTKSVIEHQQLQLAGSGNDLYDFGDTIYLKKSGSHSYTLSSQRGDKELVWDDDADSYYDESTDCWLWYNEDVSPAIWQYWYEGISSDYGDYGWMEHDTDGWYIEASRDNWIRLPSRYSTSKLWYIEE